MLARLPIVAAWLVLLGATLAQPLSSQAAFVETFDAVGPVQSGQDGPSGLIAKGWTFRNQSAPEGSHAWSAGQYFQPQAGASYLGADSLATGDFGGDISLWALLPVVPGQQTGDLLTLHVRAEFSSNHDTLELRYSPTGATGTGSTATSVGNYTTLLALVDPVPTSGWALVQMPVPGPGRIALRYAVADACNFGCFTSQIGVDTLSVGVPPPPPCNLPPAPQAGQTVSWGAENSPWQICSDLSIPAGATVIVEPGTEIVVTNGSTLGVGGRLIAHGTAAAPITISGQLSFVEPPVYVIGHMEASHLVVTGSLHAAHGGTLLVADSSFPAGYMSSDDLVGGGDHDTYFQVDRCSFTNGGLSVTDGTLSVRDTDLGGSPLSVLRGWLLIDDVSLQGAGLSVSRERYAQPLWLNDLSISGVSGPALDLSGWNFLLGPDNVITGNTTPVRLRGGLLPGTVVPTSGNTFNSVDALDGAMIGDARWAPLAVPYVVTGLSQTADSLNILPGALVRYGPGAGTNFLGEFRALGLPDQPVRLVRNGGAPWAGLGFVSDVAGPRFENCILEGADIGIQADDCPVYVDESTLRNNGEGAIATTFGVLRLRGTRFLNNGNGVRTTDTGSADADGGTNPSSFIGNSLGVLSCGSVIDAEHNWWNSPTGPQSPNNPGGTGDPASFAVDVVPFLTAPPDETDSAPVVRMKRVDGLLAIGQKVILSWDAQDDGTIATQRIVYSPSGNWPTFFLPVASGLPGTQRSFEWTVPVIFQNTLSSYFRVIATDDAGQEGFDERRFSVPYTEDIPPSSLTFLTDLSGPFTMGDAIDVCWDFTGFSGTFEVAVVNDADYDAVPYGGGTTLIDCWTVRMPYLSTDTARVAVTFTYGAGNRTVTFFSQRFTIRPDARVPDAPPAVTLLSPANGAVVAGGSTLGFSWVASDDQGLRSFGVQGSWDGGRTWQAIAEDLPPSTTTFAWTLPSSTGIANARVRVVANDLRFQSTSDEAAISVLPGTAPACQTNLGFGGPGAVFLSVCGEPLASGNEATLLVTGAVPSGPVLLAVSSQADPTPFKGGLLVPVPLLLVLPAIAGGGGQLELSVPGGGGPVDAVVQAIVPDASQPSGFSLSNAVLVEILP